MSKQAEVFMTRLDALIVLAIFCISIGSVWCAVVYQQKEAGFLGLGLLIVAGAWHEAAEETAQLKLTRKLIHYTWRKRK